MVYTLDCDKMGEIMLREDFQFSNGVENGLQAIKGSIFGSAVNSLSPKL